MAAASMRRSAEQDMRVQDYFDDKFQTQADFETLDTLIESIQSQQEVLKKQLLDAKTQFHEVQRTRQQHDQSLKKRVADFQQEQDEVDRRLILVTQSDTSDEAARRFETVMSRLHRFDVATGYVNLLKEVDDLSTECASQLGKSDEAALRPYQRLQALLASLQPLQEAAEGAAPHLIDHVAQTAREVRERIQQHFSADFEKTLKKIYWPKADGTVPLGVQNEWQTNVGRLLQLQKSELLRVHVANANKLSKDEPAVLLPYEIMTRLLETAFQFHFSGDRPTNRLDKPEWFLSHVLDLLSKYSQFCQANLQPLLLSHFRDSDLAFTPAYIDANCALITALLPILQRKINSILPQVSKQSSLFSNLIHEIMSFDTSIQDEWNYAPLSPATPFRGLAYYTLTELSYFPAWLAVERDFALSRYEAIISDRGTGQLDYDSVDASATKPSKAAVLVNDLLETITDRYRPLSSFSQRITFLIDIQIAIFDRFHRRLSESLEAYLTRTSAVARTVHGVSRGDESELSGTKGLDRLCRVYGSAEYLEKAMRDWSDDVFFLELWDELQYRAKHPESIKSDISMRDIAAKTSTTMQDGSATDGGAEMQGALFDETAASYQRLRIRSETIIAETLTSAVRDALRPYSRINPWASLSSSTTTTTTVESSLSAEMDAPLRLLDESLSFLSRALAQAPLRRVARHLAHSVQALLWDAVLARHSFATAGAAQFAADVAGLWRVVDRYLGHGQARAGMRRLADGLVLLGLPVRGEISRDVHGGDDGGEEVGPKRFGLWEVERRVFASNESARAVLEELGLTALSEGDARAVLERRVELGS